MASINREVVWISHRGDDHCARCGVLIERGMFLQASEKDGLRCAKCAGYEELCFLPGGDMKATRLATARSSRVVVVLKWSSARKRHERQGILVDQAAYDAALADVEARSASKTASSAFRVIEMNGEKLLWRDGRR